jgi:protein-S-isoprenylcysteine O-methyltransferase Ste14
LLAYLFFLSILVSTVALLYSRRTYRVKGKLNLLGTFLLCAMLFIPNLLIDYATTYEMPGTPLDYFGVIVCLAGLVLCIAAMIYFGSVSKILCLKTGNMTISGPYRWSRNPQYLGWFLFLLGFTLNDWSLWCLAALLVVGVSLHFLVLIEEQHLRRVFGDEYADFYLKTPRYLGRVRP